MFVLGIVVGLVVVVGAAFGVYHLMKWFFGGGAPNI